MPRVLTDSSLETAFTFSMRRWIWSWAVRSWRNRRRCCWRGFNRRVAAAAPPSALRRARRVPRVLVAVGCRLGRRVRRVFVVVVVARWLRKAPVPKSSTWSQNLRNFHSSYSFSLFDEHDLDEHWFCSKENKINETLKEKLFYFISSIFFHIDENFL